jgi:putative hydrolase of the HAD superfamily
MASRRITSINARSGSIRYVIFDLGDVLVTGIKDTGLALKEKHRLDVAEPRMDWATEKHPLLIPLVKEFFHGNVTEDEYVRGVLERYPQVGEAQWLKAHIRENFREVEGTREIVVRLRSLGYTLAILSNHAKEWLEHCEQKFDFHKLFDVRVYSHEIGISKPDPRSFKAVADRLNASPGACIFVDDSPLNTAAAKSLGFRTILFTHARDLERDLKGLLPDF